MVLKRLLLPILGILGWLVPASVLYFTASDPPTVTAMPPVLQGQTPETEGKEPAEVKLSLPVLIQGTTLIAENITVYDGPYLEDGTNREVFSVPVLQVHNAGEATILRTCIELRYGDRCFAFRGEWIPPGVSVALLECSGNRDTEKHFSSCRGWQETVTSECLPVDALSVREYGMGTLEVTNHAAEPMKNIQIIYKCWLSPPGIYVGGIAYRTLITELKPGETVYIDPEKYVCGYSKVVCAVTGS